MDENTTKHPLVAWIAGLLEPWRDHRDQDYKANWDEYYRIYRGIYNSSDKARKSERSTLIHPATQQQIEMAVAEQEEATFGRGVWFDIDDDLQDENKQDALETRDLLLEDLNMANVPAAISETFLLGAIYGTGIAKCIVEQKKEIKPITRAVQESIYGEWEETSRVFVRWVPVPPNEFLIDPIARTVDDGYGCAHEFVTAKHGILAKQESGVYKKGDLGGFTNKIDYYATGERAIEGDDNVKITEYTGLVPKKLLLGKDVDEKYEGELVEALVTIGNDNIILKAVENPYLMKDRPFAAYQHDTIPNRFWGRGVAEKCYHPQKGLDAELRARLDGLALTVHPMMGVDATRIPRGMELEVRAGKMIPTNGNPRDVFMPFNFGSIDPAIFKSSGDLERLVQVGGGQTDSATPTSMNARNSTMGGMSMMAGQVIKRNKRTMQNISRNFLSKVVEKSVWRYIQFYPEKYKSRDYKFIPKTTMGIMAREYEQTQLTNLMQSTPPGSPSYFMLLMAVVENGSMEHKAQAMQIVQQQLQQSMQPPEQAPDPQMVRAEIEAKRLEVDAKAREIKMNLEGEGLLLKEREIQIRENAAAVKAQQEMMELEAGQNLEQAKLAMEENKLRLDKYEVDVEASVKMAVEELKASAKQTESIDKNMRDMMVQMNAPREIIKDANGRPIGVRVNGQEKMITRDESGQPTGIE